MDTSDRRLIDDLASELSKAQPVTKDPEAASVIAQSIAAQPDAVYLLTQAVLLQQDALRNAQARIAQLEQQAQPRRGGLFGGLFGGGAQPPYGQSPYGQPAYGQQPYYAQRGGSSFLAQAASTAAGVAGGMFLFEGISNLFDGGFGGGQDQAFEQGYDQGFGNGFDQGQGGDVGQAGGQDQSGQGFDQSGWDDQGFDGGDWGA
ncbi:MAG TPA: DUF2076 domain-containing protein [Gryllotalpicola sp.]